MSGAMPGASTPAKSILCPTVLVTVSAGAASGNDVPVASVLALSVLAVSVLAVSILAVSILAVSVLTAPTPASAILGVTLGSLASGIGASPEGEAVSWMHSCLLIGGILDAPAIGPHRGYQLVIVLFDLRRDRRTAVSPPR